MAVLLILCSACSNSSLENAGKELGDSVASAVDSNNKYVLMVKNGYRENNPALTYDKAFSAFFGTPRWKYFKGDKGQDVVEFTGDCTYQDVAVKARMQFVVDEKQGTFETTYLAFNEVPQNAFILGALITKAFENNKNDSSKKSSESPLPRQTTATAIPQTQAAEIEQDALDMLYGKWGKMYTDDIVVFTETSVNDTKYDVLEAYSVTQGVPGYIVRLKIYKSSGTYIAKLRIVLRDPSYRNRPAMSFYDETNNKDWTSDKPYVKGD